MRQCHVPVVNRVEGAAKKANFHLLLFSACHFIFTFSPARRFVTSLFRYVFISNVPVVSSFAAFSVPLVSMLRCADASAVVGLGSPGRFCTSEFGANAISN